MVVEQVMSERELREKVAKDLYYCHSREAVLDLPDWEIPDPSLHGLYYKMADIALNLIRADERARTLEEVAKWYDSKDDRYIAARFVAEHCRALIKAPEDGKRDA